MKRFHASIRRSIGPVPLVMLLATVVGLVMTGHGRAASRCLSAPTTCRADGQPLPTAVVPPAYLPLLADRADLRPADATAVPTSWPATVTPTPTNTPTPTPIPPHTPGVPSCAGSRGDAGGFRFSLDGGVTLAPNASPLPDLAYTWDLDIDPRDPDVILELHEHTLFRSTDAGCTFAPMATFGRAWTDITRAPSDPDVLVLTSFLTDGVGGLLWSADGGATWQPEALPDDPLAFAIAPSDPWQWAFVGRTPVLYVRAERGGRWEARPITGFTGSTPTVTAAANAPGRWDRWLVGTMIDGIFRTDDLGGSWQRASEGLGGSVGEPPEPVTAEVIAWLAIAPSDPDVAYTVLNRVGRNQSQRAIYRSADAGDTWASRVVDNQPVGDRTAQLTGGTRVFISPEDPDVVLFPFGLSFGGYGTDLFRSNDGLAQLAVSHFSGFYEVFALAFGPPGGAVRYLGVSSDIPR